MNNRTRKIVLGISLGASALLGTAGNALAHDEGPIAPGSEEAEATVSEPAPINEDEAGGIPTIVIVGALGAAGLAIGAAVATKLTKRS